MTRAPLYRLWEEPPRPVPNRPTNGYDRQLVANPPEQLTGHLPIVGRAHAPTPQMWGARTCSSDWPVCPTMLRAGGCRANDASEGHGDRARFTSRSMEVSSLAARFLDSGTLARFSVSCPPPMDAAVGSRCSTEVTMMPLSPSSLEVLASPPISMGSSDSSSASTSLRLPPVAKINCNQWHTSDRDDSYGDSCVCSQRKENSYCARLQGHWGGAKHYSL